MSGRGIEVAVLGAGPAGIASACALRRLGHEVALLGVSRNRSLEGLSLRAHARLTQLSLGTAAASARGPVPRAGSWGGRTLSPGSEYLVARASFDAALLEDARGHGVQLEPRFARTVRAGAPGWRILVEGGELRARVVIDARGRRGHAALLRGPRLLSVARRLRWPRCAAGTDLAATAEGWCWLSADGAGAAAVQLVTAARRFSRTGPEAALAAALRQLARADASLATARPCEAATVRAAGARLCDAAPAPGYLRTGDAAVALDPLSGQGIGEALAWASAVAAATHTYMEGGAWEAVGRFLRERAAERFAHGVQLASAFYREQTRASGAGFFADTAAAYAALAGEAPAAARASWQLRPVLEGARIELRRVAVTPEAPRGVWQVDAIELAALHDYLAAVPHADARRAAAGLGADPQAVARAIAWLRARGLLPGRAAVSDPRNLLSGSAS